MSETLLNPNQVRQILDALDQMRESEGAEARASERKGAGGMIAIAPVSGDETGAEIPVLLHDVSATGVGMIHTEALERGRLFLISALPHERRWASTPTLQEAAPNGKVTTSIMFKVVYCRPMDDGRYRIGGKFTNVFRS